jgi:hypothetical protein
MTSGKKRERILVGVDVNGNHLQHSQVIQDRLGNNFTFLYPTLRSKFYCIKEGETSGREFHPHIFNCMVMELSVDGDEA